MDIQDGAAKDKTIVNISEFGVNMTPERLRIMFEKYGRISSYGILNNDKGWLRFGYIAFEDPDDAMEAVIEMNGQMIDDFRRIKVQIRAREKPRRDEVKKTEMRKRVKKSLSENATDSANSRELDPTRALESTTELSLTSDRSTREFDRRLEDLTRKISNSGCHTRSTRWETSPDLRHRLGRFSQSTASLNAASTNGSEIGHTVFVKNLYPEISEQELRRVFTPYGKILTTRVIRNPKPYPKSSMYGFVTFASCQQALRAIREKSGRLVGTQIVTLEMARGERYGRSAPRR